MKGIAGEEILTAENAKSAEMNDAEGSERRISKLGLAKRSRFLRLRSPDVTRTNQTSRTSQTGKGFVGHADGNGGSA